MKLSIIIPAHNEEKRIAGKLQAYSSFFSKLKKSRKLDYNLLVVINATKDKTEDIVKSFAKKDKNILSINIREGGKGNAIIEGFKFFLKTKTDYIGFVDADLATSPEAYYYLLAKMGEADCGIASRYIAGANVDPKPTFQRIIASRIYNFLLRSLFAMPYRDTQCGAKIFRKEVIQQIIGELTITQWAIDIDLLYHLRRAGFQIKEIPTVWSDRDYSTINFVSAGPWMVLAAIRLRIINSPLKDLVRLYDKTIGKVIHK